MLPSSYSEISVAANTRGFLTRVSFIARHIVEFPMRWYEHQLDRRMLAQLDDRFLEDMGVTRSDVEAIMSRPF